MSSGPDSAEIQARLDEIERLFKAGKVNQAWSACRDVLAFDPGNSRAETIKAEIERTGQLLKKPAGQKIETRALRCPTCRAPLEVSQKESEAAVCVHCGAVIDLTSEELSVISTLQPSQFSPRSFIKLGKVALIDGKKYQVIGRISFSSRIREWDPEDGCYYNEPWNFDEWILVSEDKTYRYLSEDEEGYALSSSFTPTAPKIPDPGESFLSLNKNSVAQRILEDSTSKIQYFEGEFTWIPAVGETIRSAEYQEGILRFSVEWRLGKDGKSIEEVEFFRSEPVSRLDLARAFGDEQVIAEEMQKAGANRECKFWAGAYMLGAVFCLLLLLGSCMGNEKKLASYTVDLATLPEEGLIRGPIRLTEKGALHKIRLATSIPDNSWSWGAVEILDQDQAPINALDGDFWRESGYDSDGHWSESDVSKDILFKLQQPGTYYVRFFSERGTASSGKLMLSVFQGVSLSRYYLLGMLICAGFGFAIFKYKTLNPLYVFVGIFALGFFILSHMGDDD